MVLLVSQSGDYIGQGQTDATTSPADFSADYYAGTNTIEVDAFGYAMFFDASVLTVGTYANASRYPFNGTGGAGLSIFGNGRGCNAVCGSFQIKELTQDLDGNLNSLWLTFTQYCECSDTMLTGEIRYDSQLAPPGPSPQILNVPADYSTIQSAIDAASLLAKDTVLVAPGTYNEAINFNGKPLTLVSSAGPAATIINAPSGSSAVTFTSGETSNSIICGFTITNGNISVSSSPTIISNVIVNVGTGIYVSSGSPSIINNLLIDGPNGYSDSGVYLIGAGSALVQGNTIDNFGGGIGMWAAGSPTIINNLIENSLGDGIGMVNQCDANIVQNVIINNGGDGINQLVPGGTRGAWIVNNTIVGNAGNGIWEDGFPASSEIINNIVVGNPALNLTPWDGNSPLLVLSNDFFSSYGEPYADGSQTNFPGNLSADPYFACLASNIFRLLPGSVCIDAGTNGAPFLPATDFDGNPRILAGVSNGPALVDLGAYEFNPAAPPTPCLYLSITSNIVVTAVSGQTSAVVTYPAPVATPTATVTCLPASGSVFPAGTNTVVCTLVYGTNTLIGTFTVTVEVPPYVTNQPSIVSVPANANATLSVGLIGTAPLTAQWSFAGNAIANATNTVLTISNAQSANEGYYQVTLSNPWGAATSEPIILRVVPAAAQIASEPVPLSLPAGSQAVFNPAVIGSAPLTCQWYFDDEPLPGAASAELIITNVQADNDGEYILEVSNHLGMAFSTETTLTVLPAKPSFTLQPVSADALAGNPVTFTAAATGSDDQLNPIRYAWYFQNQPLPGQTGSTLALPAIALTNQGAYYVVAANWYGAATSAVAQLTVDLPPSLAAGLSNLVVSAGTSLVLNPGATGTAPLACIWNFNFSQLSNSTPFLSLTNLTPAQSGYYSVTVTNLFGSISTTGKISVFLPGSQIVAWGDDSGGQTDVPSNLVDFVALAGGDYHSVAIQHDGTLVAWGADDAGQIDVPTNPLPFVAVAAGAEHNLAIVADGSVVGWGADDSGQIDIPGSMSSALAVAAGESHSLALLSSGLITAWGDDTYGQTNLPDSLLPGYYIYSWWGGWFWIGNPDWSPAQAIAAGRNHSLALLPNGTVVAWGDNSFGQSSPPASLTNAIAIAAGNLHSVALCSNGTVVAWGDDTFGETNVPPGLSNVVAIAAGDFHTLALKADGSIVGWGDDTFGQLAVPAGAKHARALASGYYHGLALVPYAPMLQPQLTRAGLVMQWNGPALLQWAPAPAGPYANVPCQGNGWTNCDMSAPAKYFRLRY